VYRVLVAKPEGKRLLGRSRRRLEDGIRMDLREIGWGSVEWIQLAKDRDQWRTPVNTVMNLRVLAPRSQSVSRLWSLHVYGYNASDVKHARKCQISTHVCMVVHVHVCRLRSCVCL
jgi:hypothetical protein